MRPTPRLALCAASAALAGCGGGTQLISGPVVGLHAKTPQAAQKLGFPAVATKNTTRVAGGDPVADAAGVALAVYPSTGAGTHPAAVTIAPTGDWQAAIAAAVLMAPPIRAPILLSSGSSLPSASSDALHALAPSGSGPAGGAQVIRVGDVASPSGLRAASISGGDPYTLAAGIDRFVSAALGKTSGDVLIASADNPGYAMPAAGWAAESGDPVLFVNGSGVPEATRQALLSHQSPQISTLGPTNVIPPLPPPLRLPHIYILGPTNVIPDSVAAQLRNYGSVKRIGAGDPADNSVAFAEYRDPPCAYAQPCAHVPGSFGWAMRSPGHGYVLINANRPLDAAAAAPLSGSGQYGPQLLLDDPGTLPKAVLSFFLNYGITAYDQYGPTAASYNHAWVIGDQNAISVPVQAQLDSLLEPVAQSGK